MSKKFKVGDKVVPISKSTGRCFEECLFWKQAKIDGKNYLIVNHIYYDGDISCGNDVKSGDGNLYREIDLIPFVEEVILTKGNIVSIKELINLVSQGLLKETDVFHVTRA